MTLSLAIYIFITVTCAFVVKGLAGFGDPLISNTLLSMKLDNKEISPSLLPVSLILNAYITFKNRKNFQFKLVASIAFWMLVGTVPGTFLLKYGSPWILKALLGVLVIGLGIEMMTRDKAKKYKPNPVIKAIISFLSGMVGSLFGMNTLFVIYMERSTTDRRTFRANTCFVMFIGNVFRVFTYLYAGMFSILTLQMTAVALPAAFCGMFIGSRLDRHINEATFRKLIVWVFILGGVSTLIKALVSHF